MYISFFMFKSRKFLILDKSFCHNSFEPISLIDHCPANRTLNKIYRRKRTTYPSRAHLCCSPETFPSDLHKVSRHEPRVGWCMSENVLLFLHHKSHYTGPSFPTSSSLHSLEREKKVCSDNVHSRKAVNCLPTWTYHIFVAVLCHFI